MRSGKATMDLAESHLDVPYEQRWELLKPTILNIYLEERATLAQLAKRMEDGFSFKAEYETPCLEVPAHHQSSKPFDLPSPQPPLAQHLSPRTLCHCLLSLISSCRVHQYRYHFKKWNIKKRITTVEKDDVITVLGKRRRQHGIGTSNVQLEQGDWRKPVDKKQIKRYINDSIRAERPLSIRPGM